MPHPASSYCGRAACSQNHTALQGCPGGGVAACTPLQCNRCCRDSLNAPSYNLLAPICPQVLSQIKATTGQSTVPQVFVGGKLLGGASDVLALLESGGLQQLLAETQGPPLPAELQTVVPQAAAAADKQVGAGSRVQAGRLPFSCRAAHLLLLACCLPAACLLLACCSP